MEIKNLTSYFSIFAVIGLFIIIIIYSVFLYLDWSKPPVEVQDSVEVNLPVIEWQKYSNLSKQYPDNTISQNNK